MKNLVFGICTLCTIIPAGALADYDPIAIKQKINNEKNTFEVVRWEEADTKDAWLAKSNVKGMVLSVGANASGIIANIADSQQAALTMLRCLSLGTIGLSPENEAERSAIMDTVQLATTKLTQATQTLNKVTFTVEPMQVGNLVILSCSVEPEKSNKP
jgi:S-methylmethionine-dependent homocysteine/selenocysteine methylase